MPLSANAPLPLPAPHRFEELIPLDVPEAQWWRQAVVYQIYPRSFYDSDSNTLGDIRGITEKVPYLQELGVDAVWLSPFYPSQLADGGYDVADYRDVAPELGTLADFDQMVAALHEAGIRVIVDIVPNHTSDQHAWFQEALASPKGSAARDRYIFRDGPMGEDGKSTPPSDWVAMFGGPQWEQVEDGQWYLHTFAPEQPDLNWSNPEVRAEFEDILAFWSDRGVDGFRVDVAHSLAKDMDVVLGPDPLPDWETISAMPWDGTHPVWDRDEVHEIYRGWREVFNRYDPPRVAVAEAWVEDPVRRARYASIEGLGQSFNFDLLRADFRADAFKEVIDHNLRLAATQGSSTTWVLSNHDVVRHATRYGLPDLEGEGAEVVGQRWLLEGGDRADVDLQRGNRRADAATMFLLGLPGSMYIYQGEELGLHEVGDLPDSARQDPTFFRSPGVDVGRDGCRVPLPWDSQAPGFGFGADHPHLPQPQWFADYAVDVEDADKDSTLNLYRRLLHLRRALRAQEHLDWEETGSADALQFVRPNGWRVIMNFGSDPIDLPDGDFLISSRPLEGGKLPGEATAWLLAK